jgi:hypothetical protein
MPHGRSVQLLAPRTWANISAHRPGPANGGLGGEHQNLHAYHKSWFASRLGRVWVSHYLSFTGAPYMEKIGGQLLLPHLSHSTLGCFACPKAFFLKKIVKLSPRPSVAAVGGKAAHALTECWDIEGCPAWDLGQWEREALAILDAEIAKEESHSGVPQSEWRVGGRASKAWPDRETLDWWRATLPRMGQLYAAWRGTYEDWEIWITPDGEPAIELEIKVPLPGVDGVPYLCYIDRIFVCPESGALMVWDAKFGSMTPEDLTQLARYAMAVELRYGVRPAWGAIYKGRTGELVPIFKDGKTLMPLAHLPSSVVAADIADQWAIMNVGKYPAKPGRHCDWCDVRDGCVWAKGKDAWKYDPHHPGYQAQMTLAS